MHKQITVKGIVGGKEVDVYRYIAKTPTSEVIINTLESDIKLAKQCAEKEHGIKILKIRRISKKDFKK